MRFTSLEVENIFAYDGASRVNLGDCTAERNIVIVAGPNGAGKTSLLNAIKLLFLGAEDDGLRRVSFGGAPISVKQFVTGQPGRWYGVFNTSTSGWDSPARVALDWEDDGRAYRAERSFRKTHTPAGFEEVLNVTIDGKAVTNGDAVLLQLLPREVVPFFFFDGEQIQSIADAEIGREQKEIERLLGLSFVAALMQEVEVYSKGKQRGGIPQAAQHRIVQAENTWREALARAEMATHSRVAAEQEVQELQEKRRKLDAERGRLRTGMAESERNRMTNRMESLRLEHARVAGEIAINLPPESPWLTNLRLVREALAVLEEEFSRNANPGVAQQLHDALPVELLRRLEKQAPPITLQETQRQRFRQDVQEALEYFGVAAHDSRNPLLNSLSPRQVQTLHRRFLTWSEAGAGLVSGQAEQLRNLRQLTREQAQIQRDLDEAEITTDEARLKYERLTAQMAELEARERDHANKATEHRIEEQLALKTVAMAKDEIRRAEMEFESVSRKNKGYQLSRKVSHALEHYRQQRRAQIRGSVEDRLNAHVGVLLGPSKLIRSVQLDDQFNMRYFDALDTEVARRSISAGMRQLVAMSMLWALKDEASRPLPVVIDTPLGRIDRQNRALLMSDYFPQAGNPLVLLPTDSELGSEDYAQLSQHIARRYDIVNTDGKDARIVERGLDAGAGP